MDTVHDPDRPKYLDDYNTLIFFVVFSLLLIFPIFRFSGMPIPLILVLSPLLLRIKLPWIYVLSAIVGSFVIYVYTLNNLIWNSHILLSDLSYFPIPIIYLVLISLSTTLLQRSKNNIYYLHIFWKLFFIIQILVAVVQYINPFDIIAFVEPYTQLLASNVGPDIRYGEVGFLERRPGGLITVSTWLGVTGYVVARWLSTYANTIRYVLYSVFLSLLTAARMAMIIIITTESIIFLYNMYLRSNLNISKKSIGAAGSAVMLFIFITTQHPYLSPFVEAFFSGRFFEVLRSSPSIQHRMTTYSYLFDNRENIIFGGLVLSEVPFSFDSEFVMRTLQFGILGYISFKLPIFAFLLRSVRLGEEKMIKMGIVLISVVMLSSLTMTTSSNMYFILIFSLLIGSSELSLIDSTQQ